MKPQRAYYLLTAFFTASFASHAATYVPFLQSMGLSLANVAWLNAWFWVTITVLEVPTGMLADGRSRQWSLRLGTLFALAGIVMYAFADSLMSALVAEVIIGIAFTFFSGVQQAWITDALHRNGEGDKVRHTFATATLVRGLAAAPAAMLGAFVGEISLRATWWIGVAMTLATLVVVWKYMRGDGEPVKRVSEIEALKESVRALHRSPALIYAVIGAVVFGLVIPLNHYWALFFLSRVPQWTLGFLWAPMHLAVIAAGFALRRVRMAPGNEAGLVAGAHLVAGVGLALAGFLPGVLAPLALIMIHELGRGAYEPLSESYVQHHVASHYRATYGSLQSLVGKLGNALVLFGVTAFMSGRTDSPENIAWVWLTVGSLLAGAAVVLYLWRPRIITETKIAALPVVAETDPSRPP